MAGGRRHCLIDPRARPARSTKANSKTKDKRIQENASLIRKYKDELKKQD
jgi:hypothetical protein